MTKWLGLLLWLAAPVAAQHVDTVYVVVPVVVNVPMDSGQVATFHEQQLAIRMELLRSCRAGLDRQARALTDCRRQTDSLQVLLDKRARVQKAEMPIGVFALFMCLFLAAGWLIRRGRQ
jgi:hypothetical protein